MNSGCADEWHRLFLLSKTFGAWVRFASEAREQIESDFLKRTLSGYLCMYVTLIKKARVSRHCNDTALQHFYGAWKRKALETLWRRVKIKKAMERAVSYKNARGLSASISHLILLANKINITSPKTFFAQRALTRCMRRWAFCHHRRKSRIDVAIFSVAFQQIKMKHALGNCSFMLHTTCFNSLRCSQTSSAAAFS